MRQDSTVPPSVSVPYDGAIGTYPQEIDPYPQGADVPTMVVVSRSAMAL